uniref:Phosphatidylinositol transfer protein alpha isoform n=1 Tax=Aceria tosichella TaxID=561515 RepID=A0A6G1SCX1_9ACAR
MLTREFRVVLPLTVEEYQIGQLFSVAEASKNETGGGEGVEVVRNESFDDPLVLGEAYPRGQYTFKIYHLKSKIPKMLHMILPAGSTEVHEHAWNAYPYCRTILTNPTYMKENFMVKIETLHAPDRGTQANPHNLPPEVMKKRDVIFIDIANDQVLSRDYKPSEDPTKFHSEKTGRGPLTEKNWRQNCEPVMCAYKLVTVEFKWYGIQNRIESFIMKQEARLFLNFHRQLFCWLDRWHGLTMQDIRALEAETKRQLDEQRQRGPLQGSQPDEK